jgi:hypothetical protein
VKLAEVDTRAGESATGAPTALPSSAFPLQNAAETKLPAEVLDVNTGNTFANNVVTPTEEDVVTPMEVADAPAQVVDVESSRKLGAAEQIDSAGTGNANSARKSDGRATASVPFSVGHAKKSALFPDAATNAKSKVSFATVTSAIVSAVAFVALFAHTWQSGNVVKQDNEETVAPLLP